MKRQLLLLPLTWICHHTNRIPGESSVGTSKDDKKWFIYLHENMYNVLVLLDLNFIETLHHVLESNTRMYQSCGTHITNRLDLPDVVDSSAFSRTAFCGVIVINKHIVNSTRWYMAVEHTLHIKVDFLLFNLTDFDTNCEMSVLTFSQYKNRIWSRFRSWRYCGQRLRWRLSRRRAWLWWSLKEIIRLLHLL